MAVLSGEDRKSGGWPAHGPHLVNGLERWRISATCPYCHPRVTLQGTTGQDFVARGALGVPLGRGGFRTHTPRDHVESEATSIFWVAETFIARLSNGSSGCWLALGKVSQCPVVFKEMTLLEIVSHGDEGVGSEVRGFDF